VKKYRIIQKKFKDGREQFGLEERFLWVMWIHLKDYDRQDDALRSIKELKERALRGKKADRDRVVHVE